MDKLDQIKEALHNLSICKTHEIAMFKNYTADNSVAWLDWAVTQESNS
jgi:hypothetical protein